MSLKFCPLYWIYKDTWKYQDTILTSQRGQIVSIPINYNHAGHIHFFMMDFKTDKTSTKQAYWGAQNYQFSIEDVWGPNSKDTNQSFNLKLIGKPMWYFYVEEYWRRVYIQPWEVQDLSFKNSIHDGYKGIKYDVSKLEHSFGPFREGGELYFFNTVINRTLPVEYWKDGNKTVRDHYLKYGEKDVTSGGMTWSFPNPNIIEWTRRARGSWYYSGDNAYPLTSDTTGWSGHHKKGDVIHYESNNKYYKYMYEPLLYNPLNYNRDPRFWPNPVPNFGVAENSSSSSADMSNELEQAQINEYLYYYDLQNSFVVYLNGRPVAVNLFKDFLSTLGASFVESGRAEEYVAFDEFCQTWELLTDEEVKALNPNGDYPVRNEVPIPNETAFGSSYLYVKNGVKVNPYEEWKKYFSNMEVYTIPRSNLCSGGQISNSSTESTYSDEDGARWNYPDRLFLSPVIEYQKVIHRNWQRLPDMEDEKNIDVMTDSGNFGDGFNVSITIPYRLNDEIQSPFSDASKQVYPIGTYCHGVVKEENKFRYKCDFYKIVSTNEEVDVAGTLAPFKKYRNAEYTKLAQTLTDAEIFDWFVINKVGTPITLNPKEGTFDEETNLWIEKVTQDRLTDDEVAVYQADGETKFGYIDSNGNVIQGGKVVEFNVPNKNWPEDGVWVEQCLGAIVKAKVEMVFEDSLGQRIIKTVDVGSNQALSTDTFVGADDV